jgi:predicted MFS family arabinose efflux permease
MLAGVETRSRWYVLFLMTLVYAINIADRFVVSTLIEPIKADFSLSDTEVGFLTGVVLAVFYVTAGIPLGVLADRVNRRNLIAISITAWSAMTALCGLAQTYWQLLLARIGVGIGEAGGTPPSLSIVSDRFAPASRAMAMSLLAVGAALGGVWGSAGGGWLNDQYGWRETLVIFGVVGLPVAFLVRFTMREPRRGELDPHASADTKASLAETLRFSLRQPSLVHVVVGNAVLTFWGWGLMWWTPTFLVRSHGLTVGEAGILLGPMHAIGGTVALFLTAWILGRFGKADVRRQSWVVAAAVLLTTVPSIVAFSTDSLKLATAMLWLFVPVVYLYTGPTFGLIQNLVRPGMRAQIAAILLFLANVANLVLAPLLIGFASDVLATRIEEPHESLRYALIATGFTGLWAAYHYHAVTRTLARDIDRAAEPEKGVQC